MKPLKTILFLIAFNLVNYAHAQSSQGDSEIEKRKVVNQIIEKIDLGRLVDQQIAALIPLFQGQVPAIVAEAGIPAQQRERAEKILASEFAGLSGKLKAIAIENAVRAYVAAFTLNELKELQSFYNTPVGMKLVTELPRLQAEGIKHGNEEGRKLGQQAMCGAFAKFKKEGIQSGKPPFC